MNPSNIIVGKLYAKQEGDQIFLGVGMRKLWTENEFVAKHLVIIYSPRKHEVGRMIQEGDNAQEGYWDDIYPLSK